MPPAYLAAPPVHVVHRWGCTGKRAWLSHTDAVRFGSVGKQLRTYRCRHCWLWHTTSPEGNRIHKEVKRRRRLMARLEADDD